MLNKQEIEEYIAELESQKNHTVMEFNLLSSFYQILDHLNGGDVNYQKAYSQAAAPIAEVPVLGNYGDSEFLVVVSGKVPKEAWGIMDDLMDTLRVVNPRVYDSVLRKMKAL